MISGFQDHNDYGEEILPANSQKHKCVSCQVFLESEQQSEHYKTQWHRYNVKRKVAGLPAVEREVFETKLQAVLREQQGFEKKNIVYRCRVCKRKFKSESTLEQHLETKKHMLAVKKEEKKIKRKLEKHEIVGSRVQDTASSIASTVDSIRSDHPLQALSVKHCLFCPATHDNMESCLTHMLEKHGFFIPFVDKVVNMEGLLLYLGGLIGREGTCLQCFKTFSTLEGVWAHSKTKDHCSINLEDEDLDQFYDFSKKTEKDSIRKPAFINEFGEIVLNDGARIGHRQNKRVYNHNFRHEDTRACVVIPKIHARYKALCMPGYGLAAKEADAKTQNREYSKRMDKFRIRNEIRKNNRKYYRAENMVYI